MDGKCKAIPGVWIPAIPLLKPGAAGFAGMNIPEKGFFQSDKVELDGLLWVAGADFFFACPKEHYYVFFR